MKAYVRLSKSQGWPAAEFPIEGSLEIGRANIGWELVLRSAGKETRLGVQDAMSSRRHVSLYFEGGQLMIRDVGSLNGTMVNNRPMPEWVKKKGSQPLQLKDGSIIMIGNTEMEVRIDVAPSYNDLEKLVKEFKLEAELSQRHPVEEAQRLANCFRIILDISENCCNTDTRVKDVNGRLDRLKGYLADDAMVAEIDGLQRRIGAELYEEEFLFESQAWEVKDFCHSFVEQWGSRFMR
ncbi:FHA domain-containing protein [Chloroflexota bacterium]